MTWKADPLASRRSERERLLELARSYVEALAGRLEVKAAAVAGSVARGDFNVWSDVDVVLLSDDLPEPGPRRSGLLAADAPAGIEPHGYTASEFRDALRRGDRLAIEATEQGVTLLGRLPKL